MLAIKKKKQTDILLGHRPRPDFLRADNHPVSWQQRNERNRINEANKVDAFSSPNFQFLIGFSTFQKRQLAGLQSYN
jgi:hypothetical protein